MYRSGAGTGYSSVGRLAAERAVTVIGEQRGTDGNTWYQIQYTGTGGAVNTGYVSSVYIRLPVAYTKDSNFKDILPHRDFRRATRTGSGSFMPNIRIGYSKPRTQAWTGIRSLKMSLCWGAPCGHRQCFLLSLKSVANGAYNWDNSTWTGFDGSNWVAASEDIIRYYMDPRNFLDETYAFQFLNHEYDANTQTKD